jgi:glycosyltransferase involved in cell wall biosynthesis
VRITVIADPVVPVPPRGYGGTERVVFLLCEGLVARGHDVVLLAGPGSRTSGRLVVHRAAGSSLGSRMLRKALFQPLSLAASRSADVVQSFGRVDYLGSLLRSRIPLVHGFANPIVPAEVAFLTAKRRTALRLVSISDAQRKHIGSGPLWRTVFNGVDVNRLPFVEHPSGEPYLAFLGRLTANKGVHLAIRVALEAGVRLRIAGNVASEPGGREYFDTYVAPHLGSTIEWVGEIGDAEKPSFLGHARGLLFPIQWDEPFGLVVAEALACGTPVIAWRRGSTPELIVDGVSGFLCDSVEDMVTATRGLETIRRGDCRRECVQNMSADRMVEQYLSIYRELCTDP